MIGVTLALARVTSIGNFLRVFKLDGRPTSFGGWGVLFGIGLASAGLYFVHRGLVHDTTLTRFLRSAEPARRVLLLTILLVTAPFLEEPVMRGFLYPAFRGSYHAASSMVIVVTMSLLMHPDALEKLGVFTILIITLNLALCLIRERSKSLWDCILCHLAYNATLALADIWQIVQSS
jgi:membrane protease YdiL (CAAX protease family)